MRGFIMIARICGSRFLVERSVFRARASSWVEAEVRVGGRVQPNAGEEVSVEVALDDLRHECRSVADGAEAFREHAGE